MSKSSNRIPYLCLCLFSLLACLFFFRTQRTSAIDGSLHLLRLVAFDYHVSHGVWYPRWLPELAMGYGYPLLHFYGPAIYFLAEALHVAGLSHVYALIACYLIFVLLASMGIYHLAYDLVNAFYQKETGLNPSLDPAIQQRNQFISLAVSAIYLFTPYFLINLYVRGALAETAAQALLPWIVWSFRRLWVAQDPMRIWGCAVLSLGLLALTHLITLVFVVGLLLAYFACMGRWGEMEGDRKPLRTRLLLVVLAVGAAAGWSAFFWLPVFLERSWLASVAFEFAKGQITENAWQWSTILNWQLPFAYTPDRFYRLGILQLLLAVLGFFCGARQQGRWSWEWKFWGVLSLITCLAISQLAVPLWLQIPFLLMAQFPWRLLTILSLSLALLSGGVLFRLNLVAGAEVQDGEGKRQSARCKMQTCNFPLSAFHLHPAFCWFGKRSFWLVGIGLLLIVFAAHHIPLAQIPQLDVNEPARDLDLGAIPQFEADTNAIGLGSAREFMPRWAAEPLQIGGCKGQEAGGQRQAASPCPPQDASCILLQQANPYEIHAIITATVPSAMRFATYYFPGWQATINHQPIQPYPDAQDGLLTVKLPTGRNELSLTWQGSPLQEWAGWLSIRTLLLVGMALARFVFVRRPNRPLHYVCQSLLFLALGSTALWRTTQSPHYPTFQAVDWQEAPASVEPLKLLGYASAPRDSRSLYLFPYWYLANPSPALRASWSIRDTAGHLLSQVEANSFFNSLTAQQLPAQAIIDDAYILPLPPDLTAGRYRLFLQLRDLQSTERFLLPEREIGTLDLPATPPEDALSADFMPLDLTFAGNLALDGYTLQGRSNTTKYAGDSSHPIYPTFSTQEVLNITLYWRLHGGTDGVIEENYHSFLHLLNAQGMAVLKIDHMPGSIANYPRLWNDRYPVADPYALTIPADLPSGLYTPLIGLYPFHRPDQRLAAFDERGVALDDIHLATIKIVSPPTTRPTTSMTGRIGSFASLQGFTLQANSLTLQPNQSVTLTLFYQSQAETTESYTRFIQLYSPTAGMITQMDSLPQAGANPTNAWLPGEVIVDTLPLQIANNAQPGRYRLLMGFYDKEGRRVALTDEKGEPVQDQAFILAEIEID